MTGNATRAVVDFAWDVKPGTAIMRRPYATLRTGLRSAIRLEIIPISQLTGYRSAVEALPCERSTRSAASGLARS